MAFVQFRIHPGVGCARIGNSAKAYHLASEFPYFLQEEFPNLRFQPKARVHPKKFFANDTDPDATGVLAGYNIYDTTPAFENAFKENTPSKGVIFPQGVRFRVFAYVYDNGLPFFRKTHPRLVFEVTADMADITWKVDIANKKSHKSATSLPDENAAATTFDLVTSNHDLLCKRIRPRHVDGLPNLAYIFLERDDADKSKVTGRLHVIGNEGDIVEFPPGKPLESSPRRLLWSDDWYDSAGDGPVQAIISPKGDTLRIKAEVSDIDDLEYLSYDTDDAQPGTTVNINAMPAWVVVGPPDYVPDMGHFVSVWDIALDRGFHSLETGTVISQPGKHKLIRKQGHFSSYRQTDYLIHIHPHLCLFDDVKFVSGEANGDPEGGPVPPPPPPVTRAHNQHPGGAVPPPVTEKSTIAHGGILLKARAIKDDLEDQAKLKEKDFTKPIGQWMKKAIYERLRKPETLYDEQRKFLTVVPTDALPQTRRLGTFPRKLGRRMDYDRASGGDKDKMWEFPSMARHAGNLRRFHGLPDSGLLCGKRMSPPTAGPPGLVPPLTALELTILPFLDDMYWPATFSDMPMLRELAYTPLQYDQFKAWATGSFDDVLIVKIFKSEVLTPSLITSFTTPVPDSGAGKPSAADKYFADYLAQKPKFAPAIIDMAAMGAMLGGSFLPGIEVGREAGIAGNWCLFHGATEFFPTIRFKPVERTGEHSHGTLTKDLSIPWSQDFKECDEKFWPTSRPGRTTKTSAGARQNWQIVLTDSIPHLGGTVGTNERFVKEYWKALGFIRRNAANEFLEQEQSWH